MRKRVYIVHTGGTLGMQHSPNGYTTVPGHMAELLAGLPELNQTSMPEYTLREYDPLLDSSNLFPEDWLKIAGDIAEHYDEYDGFVILHGTDTMAYTASSLAFMLEGLGKPVILTGSQIPLGELRSDGRANLITALLLAADYRLPEVCLYFGGVLLRGCRAVKVDAEDFEAFSSPNYPPLGEVGADIEINWQLVRKKPQSDTQLVVQPLGKPYVGALRLFPGITSRVLENILRPPLKGLVLEVYGVGNAPDRDEELLKVLSAAADRGVVIVASTQCLRGTVHLGDYSTGTAIAQAGVISGCDMTSEATLTKLFYLFSRGYQSAEVKQLMLQDLRGELTPETL